MAALYTVLALLAFISWALSLITAFSFGRMAERRSFQLWVGGLLGSAKDLILNLKGDFEDESGNADTQRDD